MRPVVILLAVMVLPAILFPKILSAAICVEVIVLAINALPAMVPRSSAELAYLPAPRSSSAMLSCSPAPRLSSALLALSCLTLVLPCRFKIHQDNSANTCLGMGIWQLPCPTSSIDSPEQKQLAAVCLLLSLAHGSPPTRRPCTRAAPTCCRVAPAWVVPRRSGIRNPSLRRGAANDTRSCARGVADPAL